MDWKLDLYTKIAAARGAARDRGVQHVGPVDHQAVGGVARRDQAALLRHPLLQSAALHGAGGADRRRRPPSPRCSTSSRPSSPRAWARAWCAPRTRRTSSPTASASPACWRRCIEAEKLRPQVDVVDDLTGKKIGRASSGTFRTADVVGLDTMAHVDQDDAGQPAGRPVLPALRDTEGARRADRRRGARPEDRRWLLQEGRQGHPAPRPAKGDYVPVGGKADPIVERMLKKPARRAAEAAARIEQPAGAVPVVRSCATASTTRAVHLDDDRRQRARRRLRDALGLRPEAGPVRAVAGGGLEAGGAVDRRRHRRRARRSPTRRCRRG